MQPWAIRIGLLGLMLCAAWMAVVDPPVVLSQTGAEGVSSDQMQIVSTLLPTGVQQIVVVDPSEKSMAVYHVEPAQGKVQLKSVRRLTWDLRMEQFNAQTPLPSELREVQP